jgi:hypothetical protein
VEVLYIALMFAAVLLIAGVASRALLRLFRRPS